MGDVVNLHEKQSIFEMIMTRFICAFQGHLVPHPYENSHRSRRRRGRLHMQCIRCRQMINTP